MAALILLSPLFLVCASGLPARSLLRNEATDASGETNNREHHSSVEVNSKDVSSIELPVPHLANKSSRNETRPADNRDYKHRQEDMISSVDVNSKEVPLAKLSVPHLVSESKTDSKNHAIAERRATPNASASLVAKKATIDCPFEAEAGKNGCEGSMHTLYVDEVGPCNDQCKSIGCKKWKGSQNKCRDCDPLMQCKALSPPQMPPQFAPFVIVAIALVVLLTGLPMLVQRCLIPSK